MNERSRELLGDPGLRRCWEEVVTGERPLTLDGIVACYGDDETAAGDGSAIPATPPPPSALGNRTVIVPRELVDRINRTYEEVSRHGYLTERDFEERLYRWVTDR